MTNLTATTGQPFNSLNFGEGATTDAVPGATRIEGHLDVVSTSPDILNLTSRVWFDDNGDGLFNAGDYYMGTVEIKAGILAQTLPNGITFLQAQASGHARATFTDDRLGQVVATAMLAAFHFNYSITDTGTGLEYTLLDADEVNPMTIFAEDDSVTLSNIASRFYNMDGADSIHGGTGNDTISALGGGVDSLYGGGGNDVIRYQGTGHTLLGGAGHDRILTIGSGMGTGTNVISGGAGNDRLAGGRGVDQVSGGTGHDRIIGGGGADVLHGGTGNDRFVFQGVAESRTGRADVIADFRQTLGNRDVMDLQGLDAISTNALLSDAFVLTSGGGTGAFTRTAGELRWFNAANTTLIRGDVTGDGVADFQITLTGILTLGAADFDL